MFSDDIQKLMPPDPIAARQWLDDNFEEKSFAPTIELKDIDADTSLRRFIDLPKLFDLLKNKRLALPRLRDLMAGDPFECHARKELKDISRLALELQAKQLERLAPNSAKGTIYPTSGVGQNVWSILHQSNSFESRFDSQIRQMSDEELRNAVWYLERERLKNELVCSCWHKGTEESDAMWKIYASQLGVTISTSGARMRSAIKMIAPKIYVPDTKFALASVRYEDVNECVNREPWLIKRKAFEHEKEVRLYCDVPFVFGPRLEIEVDIPKFIEEIVITPFAATWQISGIKGAIEALLKEIGESQIKVRQSRHMRAPEISWPPDQKSLGELFAKFATIGKAI